MSVVGIVSRVTPVHTAVRNCTRDEGGPFEGGNQVLAPIAEFQKRTTMCDKNRTTAKATDSRSTRLACAQDDGVR